MYLSSESGEIRGLSFKAIILLISELLSIKMTEICVWKTCQQDIVHVSSKSAFVFGFVLVWVFWGEGVLIVVLVYFSDTAENSISHS